VGAAALSTHYRPDIDGLRAVAVIPVVLFHSKISLFGVGLFPGGFVGVDIFFVISGYLISNILLHDIRRDQFSILTFYERRIRRIFPALFAVLLFAACAAFVILLPGALGEMDYFGTHLFGATFFYSNYQFMSETGYFAAAAEDNPLLHLWSLAVEEQFYIVFPVYLYLVSRFFRDRPGLVTMAVLLVSLVYSIYLVQNNPAAAFYSTPARAWELMLGAMIAIYPRKAPMDQRLAQLLTVAGSGFIIYSILFYSEAMRFPGAAALTPCVGAALILYTGQSNVTQVSRLLSTGAFRYPGLISYSLYLWHWPVLVFYRLYAITPLTHAETAMLLAVMTAAAWASWKFIEAPFRTRNVLARQKPLFAAGAGVMLVSAAAGAIIGFNDGFPGRVPDQVNRILAAKGDRAKIERCEIVIPEEAGKAAPTKICMIGANNPDKVTFAVWGDSYAEMLTPGIDAAAKRAGVKGILFNRNACSPLLGHDRLVKGIAGCPDSAAAAIAYLTGHPEISHIFLISRWTWHAEGIGYKNDEGPQAFTRDPLTESLSVEENRRVFKRSFERTLAQLQLLGRQVAVVTSTPEMGWNIPAIAARANIFSRDLEFRLSIKEYTDRQAFVTEVFNENKERYGLTFIRPHEEMCDAEYCAVFDGEKPVYSDDDHITQTYALKLSHLFDPIFQEMAHKHKQELPPRDAHN